MQQVFVVRQILNNVGIEYLCFYNLFDSNLWKIGERHKLKKLLKTILVKTLHVHTY